eukprot:2862877-Rhodomonas_salina.1
MSAQICPHPNPGESTDSKGLVTFDYSSVRARTLLESGDGTRISACSGKATVWKEGKQMGQISEPLYHVSVNRFSNFTADMAASLVNESTAFENAGHR